MQDNTVEWDVAGMKADKKRPSAGHTFLKVFLVFITAIAISIALSWPVIQNFSKIQEYALRFKPEAEFQATAARIGPQNLKPYLESLDKDLAGIQKKMSVYLPKGNYLIINTSANSFRLMNEDSLLREGMCSTGSYTVLQAGEKQQWIFKTPRGMFKILNKVTDPVWKKPDWAFVEEGLPVPSANHPSRYEYGVLGDYSMILGDGYMIHGTLYKRFLGMPVTHGCVRMGDDDLEAVFKSMPIGSKVYIY
ncbi:MAG: L,D-transpeptidase [Bacteroidales bacterium]|jgi:L,D-transpeptidase ErfK/SrfK|nr:L,D-transpeptidase [Bacteroidales bacterium]